MIVYFADRDLTILGHASTNLPSGNYISQDKKISNVETGVASFDCTILFRDDNRQEVENMCEVGNYLLRSHEDENEFYTIIESEIDAEDKSVYVYCEDAGLDLLNEVAPAFTADAAHNIAWYINKWASPSGWQIGINEISDLTRTLKWDSASTVTARLDSVATEFDNAELSYSYEIKGFIVIKRIINIYKKRGKDNGEQLRLGKELSNITVKKSITNLATGLLATGGTPEGQENPITLQGYTYDDGDIYVDSAGILKSRKANEKWRRYCWEQIQNYEGYIITTYSYDTTTQSELFNRTKTQLQKVCEPEINYEVDIIDLPKSVRIGDTVYLVNDADNLYISSRVLKLETSITGDEVKATLGDFLIKTSGIAEKVQQLANQFAAIAKARQLYTWIIYADNDQGLNPTMTSAGKAYIGIATNRLTPLTSIEQITDLTIFKFSKIQGEDGGAIEDVQQQYYVSTNPDTPVGGEWLDEITADDIWDEDGNKGTIFTHEIITVTGVEEPVVTPATRASALNVVANSIYANYADIRTLDAEKIDADYLNANVIDAINLNVDDTIDADKINADQLNARYVRAELIDGQTINVDEEWVKQLNVTGKIIARYGELWKLDAVVVSADNLEANTITADKLLLKNDEDGLYYQLNIGAGVTPSEQGYSKEELENGLVGQAIIAHSITAEQITTENIQGTNGWMNLAEGKFSYLSSDGTNGISFDGEKLRINVDSIDIISTINQTRDLANATAQSVEGMNAWMNFYNDGLSIGREGSSIHSLQDNDSYEFIDDNTGDTLLSIDVNGSSMKKANIDNLRFPRKNSLWSIQTDAGGNLNIVFVG